MVLQCKSPFSYFVNSFFLLLHILLLLSLLLQFHVSILKYFRIRKRSWRWKRRKRRSRRFVYYPVKCFIYFTIKCSYIIFATIKTGAVEVLSSASWMLNFTLLEVYSFKTCFEFQKNWSCLCLIFFFFAIVSFFDFHNNWM